MLKLVLGFILMACNVFQEEKPCLILNATAVLGESEMIENSAIAFQDGKFLLVADATNIKFNLDHYQVIPAEGKYLYPLAHVKDRFPKIEELDAVNSVIAEGGEASFAILSAPIENNGEVEAIFQKGEKIEFGTGLKHE